MPFTISHAAVVLPWARWLARWRLLSAAVIGAMVPDFHFFFRHLARGETHSALSLLTFSLPVGLTCYWIFQHLIKVPMIELLPEGAYARWRPLASPARFSSVRQWLLAISGILAGAVTHLVWDAFTHEGARGVRMIPMLDELMLSFGPHHIGGVRISQDGSSLLGMAVVIVILVFGLRRGHEPHLPDRPLDAAERHLWTLCYVLSVGVCSLIFYGLVQWHQPQSHSMVLVAGGIAIAILRGIVAGLCGASILLNLRLRALRDRSARLASQNV
jgi:hypothetical protein